MAKLNVTNDMSEQFEYNSPSLPIRSMTCELADFSGQTSECHWHDDLEFLPMLRKYEYLEQKYVKPLLSEESADAIVLSPKIRWQNQLLELIERSMELFRKEYQSRYTGK